MPGRKQGRPGAAGDFDLDAQPGIAFRRLANLSHAMFLEMSGQSEITGPQLTVLVTLAQKGPQIQSEIGKAVGMDKNTIAEMLRRMETRGLVSRKPLQTDRRAVGISITAEGRRTAAALVTPAKDVGTALIAPLPPEYRPLFAKCLDILVAAHLDKRE